MNSRRSFAPDTARLAPGYGAARGRAREPEAKERTTLHEERLAARAAKERALPGGRRLPGRPPARPPAA